MEIPAAEKRKCQECLNDMTLNLFRLNKSICRFCEDGMAVPQRLISSEPIEINQTITESIVLDSINQPIEISEQNPIEINQKSEEPEEGSSTQEHETN